MSNSVNDNSGKDPNFLKLPWKTRQRIEKANPPGSDPTKKKKKVKN